MRTFLRAFVVLCLLTSPALAAGTFTVQVDSGSVIKPFDSFYPTDGQPHTVWVDLRQATTFRLSADAYNRDPAFGVSRIYTQFRTTVGGQWRSLSANGCGGLDAWNDTSPVTVRGAQMSGVCPIFAGARAANVQLRITAVKGAFSDTIYPQLMRSAIVQFFIP